MSVRFLLRALPVLVLGLGSIAYLQTVTDPNEGSQLEYDSVNEIYRFKWWGKTGRTYFIQHSEDLVTWTWVPVIEPGDDSIKEWGFTSTGDKFFLRLKYTDQATSDPEGDDFDNDGVSNLEEIQNGEDPFTLPTAADQLQVLSLVDGRVLLSWNDNSTNETGFLIERSDDDGDTWSTLSIEAANATHCVIEAAFAGSSTSLFRVTPLNGAGSATSINSEISGELDPDGNDDADPLTNIEEIGLGTNPFKADTDGDLLADNFDGWATVQELAPERLPLVRYALIDLGVGQGDFVNDQGQAVYHSGSSKYFWENGVSTPIAAPAGTVWNSTVGLDNSGRVVLGVTYPNDYQGPGWNQQNPGQNSGTSSSKGTVRWTPDTTTDLTADNIFTAATMQDLSPISNQSYYETMPVVRGNLPIAVSSDGKVAATTVETLNGEGPGWSTTSAVVFLPSASFIGTFKLDGSAPNAPTEWTQASLVGINSSGVAIGSYETVANNAQPQSGYAYWSGLKHGLDGVPTFINDDGHIFGAGVIWLANHNYKKMALPNGPSGYINNKLQSVAGTQLWQNYQWHDLTQLVDLTGWSNLNATRISSDRGLIAGTTTKTADSVSHAVLLVPKEMITINTFIPQNNIDPVLNTSGGTVSGSEVFNGNDRNTGGAAPRATWDKNGSYKTHQQFNVIPFQNVGDADGLEDNAFVNDPDTDGLKNDAWLNATGITQEFDKASSLDASGNLTAAARADTNLNDHYLKIGEGHSSTSGMAVAPTWLGDRKIKVHCVVSAANPLVTGAPAIDYDTNLTVDYTNTSDPRYSLEGEHDGFPAYEFYIGDKRIYQHDPLATGEGLLSLYPPLDHDVNEITSHLDQPIPR
jgi:hypothetical protein